MASGVLAFLLLASGLAAQPSGAGPQSWGTPTEGVQSAPAGQGRAAAGGALGLKRFPKAHGPNIVLGDLVEQDLPAEAAAMAVKPSGGPGSLVVVDPALVALKLREAPGGPWTLKPGYTSILVQVPAQKIPGHALLDFAQRYLAGRLSGTPGVRVENQGRVFGLTLYDSQVRLRARLPEDHPLCGYVEMRIEVLQDDVNGEEKVVATVPVSFLVHRHGPRLFSTQPINRGDPLGPQNLESRDIDTTFEPDGFSDLGAVQGRVAKTYVPPGRPLQAAMVDLPLAIHLGDVVRLLVRSGGVEIETTGKAMRDARVGDGLPVQIPDTGKQVQARCVDADVAVENAW